MKSGHLDASGTLRLHIEDDPPSDDFLAESTIDRLCLALTGATEWEFQRTRLAPTESVWQKPLPSLAGGTEYLSLVAPIDSSAGVKICPASAREVAAAVHAVASELAQFRIALTDYQAELATDIPVAVRPRTDANRLGLRLQRTLAGVGEAIGSDAAGLFLLDDATRVLSLRSHWQLDESHFLLPPRELRDAKADLEALSGHAVVMDSPESLAFWRAPLDFKSAACVPVSSATTPLGTLWYFSQRRRDFSPTEVNLIELAAGCAAAELEREAVIRQYQSSRVPATPEHGEDLERDRTIDKEHDTDSQEARLETRLQLKDLDWHVTSRIHPAELDRNAIVDVRRASPEKISIASVYAEGDPISGARLANDSFSFLRRNRPGTDSSSALRHVHEFLARGSTGDRFVSAALLEVAKSTGRVELVSAGNVESFVIRPHAWEPLTTPSSPLGDVSAADPIMQAVAHLHPSDWLMLLVGDRPRSVRLYDSTWIDGKHLAESLLRHFHLGPEIVADALWRLLDSDRTQWRRTPSLIVIRNGVPVQGPTFAPVVNYLPYAIQEALD